MPYVLVANRSAVETTLARVAGYVGIDGGFDGFLARVLELRDAFDVPHRLTELGVDPAQRDAIVAAAVVDPSAGGNPLPFTEALAGEIHDAACAGNLGRAT